MSGSFHPASQRPFCNSAPPPLPPSQVQKAPPLTSCVTPGSLFPLSGPQFTLLKNGDNNGHCHVGVLWGPPEETGDHWHVANKQYLVAMPLVTFGLPTLCSGQSGSPTARRGCVLPLVPVSQYLAFGFLSVTCVFLTTSKDSWTDLQEASRPVMI